MPLSASGDKILRAMIKQYHGSKKGKSVFYSKEHSDAGFARLIKKHPKK